MVSKEVHAQYSPSSLGLLELCPWYWSDPSGVSQAAEDGTRLHKATETTDLSLCNDEEEEEAVTRCLTFLDELIKTVGEGCKVHKEVRLMVEDLTKGTGDIVIVSADGKSAHTVDWKFGRMPVADADENIQLQSYTLGVFTMFPSVDEVTVHIVCPRMDILSTATYKRSDCDRIRERIQAIISECESPDKQEKPSDKGCRWCGRKAECKAIAETAVTVGKALGLPMPIEFEAGKIVLPEDRARAQVLSYILEDWATQIRKFNSNAVIEDGIEIPGFEIRSKKGRTSVVDVFTALQELVKSNDGLALDELLMSCTMSIPKAVDILYAKSQVAKRKETKKAIRETVDNQLKELVSVSETVTFLQRKKGKTNEDIIKELT